MREREREMRQVLDMNIVVGMDEVIRRASDDDEV